MKKNISVFVLLAFLNQIFLPYYCFGNETRQNYAVAQMGRLDQKQSKAQKVLARRIQAWMENGPFGQVQISFVVGAVQENELLLEQLKVQLVEYTRTLKKAVLEASDKSKGEKSLQEIKSLRKKMNITGRFGPLLYKSYLAESAFYWKSERFDESEAALKKAIQLYPLGKPVLDDWDQFATSFGVFSFEKEIARVYQKMNRFCETAVTLKQKNVQLKVNGFDVKDIKVIKLASNAIHVFAISDDKGHTSESIFNCLKKSQKSVVMDITKGTNTRSELTVSDALKGSGSQGLFLSKFNKREVELFFYTQKAGITPIALEKKVTVSELVEGAQEFSLPVSYSSMNKILTSHYGSSMIVANSALKGNGASSSLFDRFSKSQNKWYNNSVLWGIVGGLAVGAATTYVLTREGDTTLPKALVTMEVQ